MKNRNKYIISMIVMIIALGFMAVNFCFYSLPDWGVRLAGLIILADVGMVSYSAVKLRKGNM